MNEEIIKLSGLTKRYGYGDTESFALKDFDLTIRRGEFIMIMGPSGCGKTTLLNIIGLLDRATDGTYILDGEDVTEEIRTPKVDSYVAKFAAIKQVRKKMTPLQREMKSEGNIIMEGRDIGTVVFPDAEVKIYLDATVEERANRRYKQNIENGIKCTYEEVLKSIKERHILETTRKIAPLKQADDAIYLDTTKLSIEEVTSKVIEIINSKI